jgi:hypothetical protein
MIERDKTKYSRETDKRRMTERQNQIQQGSRTKPERNGYTTTYVEQGNGRKFDERERKARLQLGNRKKPDDIDKT